jgi:hypothetical protein
VVRSVLILVLALGACGRPEPPAPAPVPAPPVVPAPPPLSGASQLVAGHQHACALVAHEVLCWGAPYALGGDDVARPVAGLGKVVELVSRGRTLCARDDAGAVRCWGERFEDGGVAFTWFDAPVLVTLPDRATQLAAGTTHACARLDGGRVFCWGAQHDGKAERIPPTAPRQVASMAEHVTAGHGWTCVEPARTCFGQAPRYGGGDWLASPGTQIAACSLLGRRVVCQGENHSCILGHQQGAPGPTGPVGEIPGLAAIQLTMGAMHACVLDPIGRVRCWGSNVLGQLGDMGGTACEPEPRVVALPGAARSVAAGGEFTCALLEPDGHVACWGRGRSGRQDAFGGVPPTLVTR